MSQLNANTLYLCLSQGVPPPQLRPSHTVANVLALLDAAVADLGRCVNREADQEQKKEEVERQKEEKQEKEKKGKKRRFVLEGE